MSEERVEEVVVDKTQQVEIDDIIGDFVPATPEAPEVVEPIIETKQEDKTDGDKGEERAEEETSKQVEAIVKPTEEVKQEEVVVERKVEETELDRIKRENAELRAHMEEVVASVTAQREPKPLTPEQQTERTKQQEAAARQVLPFLKDDAIFDEVMKSSTNFNALLTSVVNTAVAKMAQMLPNITTQYVDNQMTTRLAVQSFYGENKDLLPHKKYVGFVSNELLSKNPDWSLEKNLEETEKEVRSRLKLTRTSGPVGTIQNEEVSRTVENPGFVPGGGSGGRRSSVNTDRLSGTEKDIMDLIS